MSKKTFLKGATILGVAGLLVQVMGAIFRIPLANIIGEEGMGYFQTAYPVYVFLLVFSTNGAPAAISKMTSERIALGQYAEAHRVFKLSFMLMLGFGLVAFLAVFCFAEQIVELVKQPGAYYSMRAIAPALLFVPLMAVFRGYFQGMQIMTPTAVSQLIEQAVRVIIGLTLAVVLLPKGLEIAAAGASFGTSVGPVAGVIILALIYFSRRKKIHKLMDEETKPHREKGSDILKTLAALAIPTTIGVSILPIMNVVDMAISMARMQVAGFTEVEAGSLYGLMSGFAAPIINIPMALALSIAISMVPAIAAAKSTNDRDFLDTNIRMGMRTAMLIGVPCSFGLMILAEPIMRLLYAAKAESAASAAPCLAILAAGIIFLSIAQTMAGILQGLGRPSYPVIALLAGVVIKFILTYFLAAVPTLNINGAALGSTVGYLVIALMNVYFVKKMTEIKFDMMLSIIKPLTSGIVMGMVVGVVYLLCDKILGNSLSTVAAIGIGAIVYVIMIIKTKSIQENEFQMLPKGDKLVGLLKKVKLL